MVETQKSDPVLSWKNLGLGVETNPVHICSWTEGSSRDRAIPQEGGPLRDELFAAGGGGEGHRRQREWLDGRREVLRRRAR